LLRGAPSFAQQGIGASALMVVSLALRAGGATLLSCKLFQPNNLNGIQGKYCPLSCRPRIRHSDCFYLCAPLHLHSAFPRL